MSERALTQGKPLPLSPGPSLPPLGTTSAVHGTPLGMVGRLVYPGWCIYPTYPGGVYTLHTRVVYIPCPYPGGVYTLPIPGCCTGGAYPGVVQVVHTRVLVMGAYTRVLVMGCIYPGVERGGAYPGC